MNAPINDLSDLFFDQLRDLHSVESQVAETLPHLSQVASLPTLRDLFTEHRPFTLEQKRQIAAIFETHSRELGSDECLAMKGLIEGGNKHLTLTNEATVRDFMLVAHWIRIKHYEIAAYQITAALALHLDYLGERDLLSGFLAAEERAVKELEGAAGELFAEASGNVEPPKAPHAGS